MDATVQTLRIVVRGEPTPDPARLNPAFRYIRVTVDGRTAYLALGYVDAHPHGPIEVWYSARREVLRLQNGRVVGAVGLTSEWRDVVLPELPSWSVLADRGKLELVRTRDVMPGYRYGVKDALVLQVVPPPAKSALHGQDPKSLTWFEERLLAREPAGTFTKFGGTSGEEILPPARYAVDLREGREIVVYGEQCLSPEFCFAWQRWEVTKP